MSIDKSWSAFMAAKERNDAAYAAAHASSRVAGRAVSDEQEPAHTSGTPQDSRPQNFETLSAMRGVKLCAWCQDRHFRPYPEQAASSCNQVQCQCWCTQGTGQ